MRNTTPEVPNGATPDALARPLDEADGAGKVDKIREIIFGSQMRDYDRKFAQLEDRLLKEATEAREDLQRRFSALEAVIREEVSKLTQAVQTESTVRAGAITETRAEMKNGSDAAGKKAAETEEQNAQRHQGLRTWMESEAKRLAEENERRHAATTAELQREAAEIRGSFTAREGLSDLLAELATRLKDGSAPKK